MKRTYVGSCQYEKYCRRENRYLAIWTHYMSFINHCICWVNKCRNLSCGIGTAKTDKEWDGTERILGCESVRRGNRSQSEWHLSRCTSGFRSEPSPRATRGFHWGYMLQGRPLPVRRQPEAAPPLHLESCWTPPQQAPLDPLSTMRVVFFFSFSSRFSGLLGSL